MQFDDHRRLSDTPTSGPVGAEPRSGSPYAMAVVLLATAGFFLARLPLLPRRVFDPDEFEHSHAAWCLFKGMLPYRDFFEHHTPWYYYTLRPFFEWFAVDTSFESARHFLIFGRALSLFFTLASVLVVWQLGRLWDDRRVGLLAGLLLVSQPVFFQKTIEMRPDVLALPFFLGGLWFLLRGLATPVRTITAKTGRNPWYFLGGGLGLGAAIMCTQKMLFVLPGLLAGLGIWSLSGGSAGRRVLFGRMVSLLMVLVGIAVPALLTWGTFALHQAGGAFVTNNFLLNAHWKHTATNQLLKLVTGSWPMMALSLLGIWLTLKRFRTAPPDSARNPYGDVLLLCTLAGLFLGLLVVPVAHRQYYLMPLPILCLYAARGLVFLVGRARAGVRDGLLVVALLPLAVLPVLALRDASDLRNDQQLARLRYVFDSTAPTDLVMDGWEGTGVFRPHAFYYFFLHEEAVAMLPKQRLDAYLTALETGTGRPRLIAMDQNLRSLGSRFVEFVNAHYRSDDGFFYRSRDSVDRTWDSGAPQP